MPIVTPAAPSERSLPPLHTPGLLSVSCHSNNLSRPDLFMATIIPLSIAVSLTSAAVQLSPLRADMSTRRTLLVSLEL